MAWAADRLAQASGSRMGLGGLQRPGCAAASTGRFPAEAASGGSDRRLAESALLAVVMWCGIFRCRGRVWIQFHLVTGGQNQGHSAIAAKGVLVSYWHT